MSEDLYYIGYYCDDEYFKHLLMIDKMKLSQARQNLEKSIITGLSSKKTIKVVSYVPFSSTKKCNKKGMLSSTEIEQICVKRNPAGIVKGSLALYSYLKHAENGSQLLMYAVNPMFVIPAFALRKKKKFVITTICSELPQYRRWKNKIKNRIKHRLQGFLNKRFDKYILLAEEMKNVIPIIGKPYIVIESIYTGNFGTAELREKKKTIMYAGGLTEDNGIHHIIEGFQMSDAEELWICGSGPLEKEIESIAGKDERIKYYGMLSVDEVRKMEEEAYLLICLRDSNNPLTKYSFPSKVLEYLASGTMVIANKLKGIPVEYFDYVQEVDDYSSTSVKQTINRCINLSSSDYYSVVNNQLSFVKERKSGDFQCSRILDFLFASDSI